MISPFDAKAKNLTLKKNPPRKRYKNHPDLTREYVEKAIDEYLKSGGKITKLNPITPPKNKIKGGVFKAVDDFLLNQ